MAVLDLLTLRSVLEALPHPAAVVGDADVLVALNGSARTLLGLGEEGGPARRLGELVTTHVEVTSRRPIGEGSERLVALRAAEPSRDVAHARLEALAAVSELFSRPVPLQQALERTAELAATSAGEWALIHRVLPGGREIQAVAAHHRDPRLLEDVHRILRLEGARRSIGAGPGASQVAATGEPVRYPLIDDAMLSYFGGSPERLAAMQRVGIGSLGVVPFRTPTGILGTLMVGTRRGSPPVSESDLAFAQQLADRVAAALAREEMLQEVVRQRAELLAIFHADPSGIAVFGTDHSLRYASAHLDELFGQPMTALVGRSAESATALLSSRMGQAGRFVERTAELFADRGLARTEDFELEAPRRFLRQMSVPVTGPQGAYLGRLFVYLDVTAERELELERSDFLTVASHELRTPLTPLSMALQALERKLARGEPADPSLVIRARRQAGRLNALIEDLLDFSRLESGRLELRPLPLTLDALVADVCADHASSAPNHEVRCRVVPGLWVKGDRLRLEQVLVNLLQNAVKYSPRGGVVEIAAQTAGEEVRVSVRDEGIGIPEADRDRLFERFFRAQNATARHFGGLGIGLHVSREIVHRHGGRFEVESVAGRGSTFTFFLPQLRVPERPVVQLLGECAPDTLQVRQALEAAGVRVEQRQAGMADWRSAASVLVDFAGSGERWSSAWASYRDVLDAPPLLALLPPGVATAERDDRLVHRPIAVEAVVARLLLAVADRAAYDGE